MSKTNIKYGLDDVLKSKDKVFVLFYASWCPFSQEFLPMFEKFAKGTTQSCVRVMTDDKPNLCRKYSVDVVPTVLFFKNGKVVKRLDGVASVGLDEKKLMNFISKC